MKFPEARLLIKEIKKQFDMGEINVSEFVQQLNSIDVNNVDAGQEQRNHLKEHIDRLIAEAQNG